MRKLLSLFLALAMLLSVIPALGESGAPDAPLPAVGDVVEGFEVKEIREFGLIGASLVYFEHQKTGAKLLYIANSDTNRAFQLTFPTRMSNDKGIPHVFEHGTLSGSAKYPSESLWMDVSAQTYNTYMNAYTTDAMTCYPVASLSEAQLLKLADFYTDLCLNPDIMTKESIYRTEAWRYEAADADAPLTYNGTVYSEMQGAVTLSRAALMAANKITFPGASVSYDYGGDPDFIPEMTWEELKDYHNRYYHPSNCVAYLYGSFSDYTAFLKILDTAFSPFEKAEFSFEEPDYTPITEPAELTYSWPVTEGTDTANQSVVYYYILCPGMKGNVAQEQLIDHACSLLSDSSSSLMQSLRVAFPAGSFSVGREVAAPDDAIVFVADGVNEGDTAAFRELVNLELAKAAESGFTPELAETIATYLKYDTKLASESESAIEGVIEHLAYDYAVSGDIFRYVDDYEALNSIEEENSNGLLAAAVGQWLVNPALWTLTTGVPAPGQKEVHDAEIAAKLADIKAGMSAEELQAVIDATNAEPVQEDNAALLADLSVLTVATLPEEVKEYEIRDTVEENGVRRIEAVTGVDGISYVMLNLDAAALPQEDIHYLRLFTRLLGKMDTDRHSWQEISGLVNRYLYDNTFGVFVSGCKGNYHPYAVAEWYSLDEDLETGYSLVEEILYHTQFTDIDSLRDRIAEQKNYVRGSISQNGLSVVLYRQLALSSPFARYYSYLNFLDYYAFLENLEQTAQEHPEEVIARLEQVQNYFKNRSGAVAAVAGSETSLALNRPLTDAFFAALDDTAREPAAYDLPVPAAREGLIVDANIQFNIIAAPWYTLDPEAAGTAYAALGDLLTYKLLFPELRDQMGAYGAYCQSTDDELYVYTYRDPNVAETFAYLDNLPDAVNALEMDQESVDSYIISTYSGLAKSEGEMTGAVAALNNRISGIPDDNKLQSMRALKTATPETLKDFAGILASLLNTGIRGTAGSAAAINANAEMYDAVLNPFNAKDMSEVSFEDIPEDHEYADAAYAAVAGGLMAPLDETHFGIDEGATVGDLLAGIYLIVGGPANDPAGARDLLAANGLVPADQDLSAPLDEAFLASVVNALYQAEVLTTDTPDNITPRGELADLLIQMNQ